MKKNLRILTIGMFVSTAALTVRAQQIATFENITLSANSYLNGSTTPKGTVFSSGSALFPNHFDAYWKKGWAISNMKDSTTAGYTNIYSAVTAAGYNSSNYAVGQQGSVVRLNPDAINGKVNGVYVTNGTYAAFSMRDGDSFAKKFGDTTGTKSNVPQGSYPDWFKLTIKGFTKGTLTKDSVNFYLADFRFEDNSKDFIVKKWEWVDLTSLGNVDSVIFKLSSSDVGAFGINTPTFFCIDDFTTENPITAITKNVTGSIKMYPNPTSDHLTIDLSQFPTNDSYMLDIFDITGRKIENYKATRSIINLSVQDYKAGAYFITLKNNNTLINLKFIKN